MARSEQKKMRPSPEPKMEMADEAPIRFNSTIDGNRFLELKPHREAERIRAVNLGLIPDPLKPRRLDEALPFFGTCTLMCPEFERHEREYQNNSDRWERYPGTMRIDPLKAVKAFHRPAAGNDQPLPSDVRPPDILKTTLDYLFNELLPQESLFETHGFIRDRTRSIRQDFTLQNERGEIAIECHERIARYHILCLHFLRDKEGVGSYQEQQELEQVRKVLQSLNEFYDDFRGSNRIWPHEAEFRGYYLLTHLRDADAARTIERLPQAIFMDPRLQSALKLHTLAQCSNLTKPPSGRRPASSPATLNGFSRLFKQISRPQTSFLAACILETHFRDIRVAALKSIRSAQSRKYGAHVPLKELARACAMPVEECLVFCVACGLKVTRPLDANDSTVELHNYVAFDDRSITFRMPKSAMVTEKGMSLSIPELINGLHAHSEVSFVKAPPPFSARCPPQRKSSRVELISSVAFPLKAPNHHSSFLDSKIPVRPTTKTSSHSVDKAIHKSTPYRTIPTSLLTSSEYQTNPSVQPALSSPKVSVPHSAKREPVPMPYTNASASQLGSVMPKPTSHKRTSVPSATCAKAFQRSARASAHKQLLNSLCCDMLSSVIEPIASHVAQQALRNKVMRSLAEQIKTTQHFVDHLSESLKDEFFRDFEAEVAFELASTLVLKRYQTRRQHQLRRTSFYKWLNSARSHRPSPAKRHRSTTSTDTQKYFTPVGLRSSVWRSGGLRDSVCAFLGRRFGPHRPASEAVVGVVVVVPTKSTIGLSWLRCKFGISTDVGDRLILKENGVTISISIVQANQMMATERLSQVALLLLWHESTSGPVSANYAHWVETVERTSSYPVISLGVSWSTELSPSATSDTSVIIVGLSMDNPEHELGEALRNQVCVRTSSNHILTNINGGSLDLLAPFLTMWQDWQEKALARLSLTPQPSPKKARLITPPVGASGDSDLDILDIVCLFDFLLISVNLMVTSMNSLIGPALTIEISSLDLDKLSGMTSEKFYSTLENYQCALPMSYYSINLLTLLCTYPPLPLVDFFRLFYQHLASAILQLATEYILAHQHEYQHHQNPQPSHAIELLAQFESQLEVLLHDLHTSSPNRHYHPPRKQRERDDDEKLDHQSSTQTPIQSTSNKQSDDKPSANTDDKQLSMTGSRKRTPQASSVAELRLLVQSTRTNLEC